MPFALGMLSSYVFSSLPLTSIIIQYGENKQGKLLNLMQTMCPFCRRTPTAKILRKFNSDLALVGGLRDAIGDNGWYYAWCSQCGFAKRAYEKQCCDGDSLPVINNYTCTDCSGAKTELGQDGSVRTMECPSCGVMVEKVCNLLSDVPFYLLIDHLLIKGIWMQPHFVSLRTTLLLCVRESGIGGFNILAHD